MNWQEVVKWRKFYVNKVVTASSTNKPGELCDTLKKVQALSLGAHIQKQRGLRCLFALNFNILLQRKYLLQ